MGSNNHGEKVTLNYVICWLLGNEKVKKIEVENPDDFLVQSKHLISGEFKSSTTKVSKNQYAEGIAQLYKRYLDGERKLCLVTTVKAKYTKSELWPNNDLFEIVKKNDKWNKKWNPSLESFIIFYNSINIFSFKYDVDSTRKLLLESSTKKLEKISIKGKDGDRADLIINKFLNYFSGESRKIPITRELILNAYEQDWTIRKRFKKAIENDTKIAEHLKLEIFMKMSSFLENDIYFAIRKLKNGRPPKDHIERAAFHLKEVIYED